jgi:hypothetical protein
LIGGGEKGAAATAAVGLPRGLDIIPPKKGSSINSLIECQQIILLLVAAIRLHLHEGNPNWSASSRI